MKFILTIIINILTINAYYLSSAQPETRDVAVNLDTPWEILWGPDNYIWMTERYGRISRVNPETGEIIPLITLSDVFEDGERGLMGMVIHPNFNENPYLYTVYTYRTGGDNTFIKIIRFTYSGNTLSNPKTIMDSVKGYWNHDGSRLWIDDELKLWATFGDAASPNLAQQLDSRNGKILRMNLDGSVPDDNPYPGSYIWSWGHRNPQGLVFANGRLYSSEHGPDKDDEVNIIEKGRNYGWPNVNGFCDLESEKQFCQEKNVAEPIFAWTPTLAVCGLDYYNNDKFAEWKNSLLLVSLKAGKLTVLKLDDTGGKVTSATDYFDGSLGRFRDLCVSPGGRIFIATSNKDGRGSPRAQDDRIIEIIPQNAGVIEKSEKKTNISPIPARDFINFNFEESLSPVIFKIFNLQGEEVLSEVLHPGTDSYTLNLDGKGNTKLSNGIYFSKIFYQGTTAISAFIISASE